MQQKKLNTITSLRGIAAIFIVVHHYSIYLIPGINQVSSTLTPFINKSYIWVDFFFILSGFILAYIYSDVFSTRVEKSAYRKYLGARFARIYPLHLFMLLCFLLLELVQYAYLYLAAFTGEGSSPEVVFLGAESIATFFVNLFMMQTFISGTFWNQPAWSISAEWIVYLFLPFILPTIFRLAWLGKAILFMFSFIVLFFLASEKGTLDLVPTLSFLRCICEAIIGVILFDIYKRGLFAEMLSKTSATNFLFVLSLITVFVELSHLITIAVFVLLVLSAAYDHKNVFLSNKLLIFMGTISYSIYMTHWFIQVFLQKLSKLVSGKEFHENFSSDMSLLLLFFCVLLVIMTSTLTYRFIENPFRRRVRAIISRSSENSETK